MPDTFSLSHGHLLFLSQEIQCGRGQVLVRKSMDITIQLNTRSQAVCQCFFFSVCVCVKGALQFFLVDAGANIKSNYFFILSVATSDVA